MASSIAFGISSYAYPWAIGVPGHTPDSPMKAVQLLQEARRLMARRLQLADNLAAHQLAEEDWTSLIHQAEAWNIQLELGLRGLRTDLLQTYIALAQACRSSFLRVVIDDQHYAPKHDQIVATIQEVLPQLKAANVVLAIENHDRFRAYELIEIIEATDPAYVGICLDTANSLGADEGIWEVANILAPYTLNLHVKDYRIERLSHQMGFRVEGTPAGAGQTPVPWLLRVLSDYGRCQSATLEVWCPPQPTLAETIQQEQAWVDQGSAHLRACLQKQRASSIPTTH